MRYIIALFLCLNFSLAYADEVRCYSSGKLIYKHQVYDIRYFEGSFIFTEASTGKSVIAAADCIAKVEID